MLNLLTKLINFIPKSLTNRLVNKYTTQGSLLLLYVLAEQGVIPVEAVKALEGVPSMMPWVLGALAIYLILKLPSGYKNYKLDDKKLKLEDKKLDLEILKIELEEKKLQSGTTN